MPYFVHLVGDRISVAKAFYLLDLSRTTRFFIFFGPRLGLDGNTIDLLIAEAGGGFTEALRVQVRNGTFASHYWCAYVADPRDMVLAWTTKRQKLTLENNTYRIGDVISGKIDFECVQEIANPKYVEKYGKNPTTIKVHGVFKTIVK